VAALETELADEQDAANRESARLKRVLQFYRARTVAFKKDRKEEEGQSEAIEQ